MRLDPTSARFAFCKRGSLGLLSLLLVLQTGCFSIGGEAQQAKNTPQIKSVNIQGDQLLLEGYSLDRVEKVYLKDVKKTYEYKVTSQDSGSLVSQAIGSFLVGLDKTYDLILESADAEVLNQVKVSLDGAVGGTISGSFAIPSGTLGIGNAWNSTRPSPVSQLHITSSVGGSASNGEGVGNSLSTEGLTIESLLSATESNFVSLYSGASLALGEAGFLRFGAVQNQVSQPTSFYIGSNSVPKAVGVTSDGNIGVGTAWTSVRPSPISKLHIVSSTGGGGTSSSDTQIGGISSEGLTIETLFPPFQQLQQQAVNPSPPTRTYVSLFSGNRTSAGWQTGAGYLRFGPTANGASFFIGPESNEKAFAVTNSGDVKIAGGLYVATDASVAPSLSIASTGALTRYYPSPSPSSSPTPLFEIDRYSESQGKSGLNFGIYTYPDTHSPSTAFTPPEGYLTPLTINRNNGVISFTATNNMGNNGVVAYFSYSTAVTETSTTKTCSLDTTGLNCSSDRRLKKNIQPLQGALDKVLAIDGVSYSWKSDPNGATRIGFIAQDLQKTVPELVVNDPKLEYLQVSYAPYVAVLHQALKELYQKLFSPSGEVTLLQKKILEQEDRIHSLEQRLGRLEKTLQK